MSSLTEGLGPIVVAVDLHLLVAGGQNGGIKPAIYCSLEKIAHHHGENIQFEFLVNRAVAEEVAARFGGSQVHVIQEKANPLASRPGRRLPWGVWWRLRKADLLYAPLWFSPFHSRARPTVALMVDMLHRDHPAMLSGEPERRWREEIVAFAASNSARVQTISRTMAERVHDYYGVSAARLFTTYLPLQSRFEASAAAKSGPSYREGFLYPANLWPHKNHERLLAGYAQYRSRAGAAAWSLMLTGHREAGRSAALEAQMSALGLSAQDVQFPGFLDEKTFARTWETTGALIFPSLYEGFGMPLLEAMRFGVPIAASRIASIPEIAGDAALFFDPYDPQAIADAMFQLSTQPSLRSDLVKKGRERLRFFDADREVDKLADVFLTVIQEFKGGKRQR